MYEIPYHIRIGSFQTWWYSDDTAVLPIVSPVHGPEHPLTGPRQQHGDHAAFSLFYTFTIFAHFYTPYPVFYGIV